MSDLMTELAFGYLLVGVYFYRVRGYFLAGWCFGLATAFGIIVLRRG